MPCRLPNGLPRKGRFPVRCNALTSLLLDHIPRPFDIDALLKSLRIREDSRHAEKVRAMAAEAERIGKAKAYFCEAFIDAKGEDHVVIQGSRLASRILRVNLDKVYRVFPYVATCGLELEEWSKSFDDLLGKFWADAIKGHALRLAYQYLSDYLGERYGMKELSHMNPGSLSDWPISEQGPLFAILGEGPASIGIRLTESFLMVPIKSVSGIYFPAGFNYENCLLCPREKCPGRKAAYDAGLYEEKYGTKARTP
jgi:hypothetical protein